MVVSCLKLNLHVSIQVQQQWEKDFQSHCVIWKFAKCSKITACQCCWKLQPNSWENACFSSSIGEIPRIAGFKPTQKEKNHKQGTNIFSKQHLLNIFVFYNLLSNNHYRGSYLSRQSTDTVGKWKIVSQKLFHALLVKSFNRWFIFLYFC